MNQPGDLDGRTGHRLPEILPAQPRDDLAMGVEIGGVDVQFHHMVEIRARGLQALPEVLEDLAGLNLDLPFAHQVSVSVHRGLPGDVHLFPGPDDLRKARAGIPQSLRLDDFSRHKSREGKRGKEKGRRRKRKKKEGGREEKEEERKEKREKKRKKKKRRKAESGKKKSEKRKEAREQKENGRKRKGKEARRRRTRKKKRREGNRADRAGGQGERRGQGRDAHGPTATATGGTTASQQTDTSTAHDATRGQRGGGARREPTPTATGGTSDPAQQHTQRQGQSRRRPTARTGHGHTHPKPDAERTVHGHREGSRAEDTTATTRQGKNQYPNPAEHTGRQQPQASSHRSGTPPAQPPHPAADKEGGSKLRRGS